MNTPESPVEHHHSDEELPTMTLADPRATSTEPREPTADVGSTRMDAQPSSETTLFPGDDMAALRARWNDVQAGFVDDPRDCVQKADGLVTDVVGKLTASFTQARTALEGQWSRGEEASTEDLRVALTRYRDFFERLLAV